MPPSIEAFIEAVARLDGAATEELLREALARRGPEALSDELLRPALERIGDRWERGELSLAHVYMGSRVCERALDAHLPRLASSDGPAPLAIATFQDQHQLGKRLVLASLRLAGYAVRDYGAALEADELVERVAADRVEVLLLSVLMLRSALAVRDLVARLREARLPTRVVVGGAPFRLDPRLLGAVGADAAGATASDAIRLVAERLGGPAWSVHP